MPPSPPFNFSHPRRRRSRQKKTIGAALLGLVLTAAAYFAKQQGWFKSTSQSREFAHADKPSQGDPRTPSRPSASVEHNGSAATAQSTPVTHSAEDFAELFQSKAQDVWVIAAGTVTRTLPDDHTDARHQRFIIDVGFDYTLLVAHNIDAAPRVPVREGDTVTFRGQYEWSDKGGVIHFTHAPEFQRREPGGWIEHNGARYE